MRFRRPWIFRNVLADETDGSLFMAKINIGNNAFLYPMPIVLVGTHVAGKVNFMTVGWTSRVNYKPPMIAVCINKAHYTRQGIQETGEFSVNIPGKNLVEATDYCGIVSGKTIDKSQLFEVFYGDLKAAPMIMGCPLNMECKLAQTVDLPSNHLFIGEIVAAYCEEMFLSNGQPDVKKIMPILLTMPDNSYWTIGDHLASAWSIGKTLKRPE